MVSALHDCLDRAPTLSSIKRQAEVLSVPSLHSLRHVTSFTKRMAKHIERAGVLRRLWTAYCHQLVERPILTRACTSATGLSTSQRTSIQRRRVGMALGDAVAQVLTVPGPFELQRTMTFGCFGFFFHGPALYYFYRALDQNVFPLQPKHVRTIAVKTGIDQFFWSPIFLILFFGYMEALNGQLQELPKTLDEKFLVTYLTGLMIWIPANLVNFAVIPIHLRLLYINTIAVGWMTILSVIQSQSPSK